MFDALADLYPGSVHVSEVGLAASPDRAIWAHARDHGLVIVTKDENFHRLSVLLGPPPKVMLGNCSTDDVVRLLQVALPLDCYRTRVVEFGRNTIRSADWHGSAT